MPGERNYRRGGFLLTALALCLALASPQQAASSAAGRLEFSLYRNDGSEPGNTLLVVGGIQGDEPGGFNAASLLVTHYRFTRGSVWVVPNLNFESIVRRSRGVYGDMNRKFPKVPPSDPDYDRVEKIKRIITDEEVDFVFNLHDGSGFYRERHIDRLRIPLTASDCLPAVKHCPGPFRRAGRARQAGGRPRQRAARGRESLVPGQEHPYARRQPRNGENPHLLRHQ